MFVNSKLNTYISEDIYLLFQPKRRADVYHQEALPVKKFLDICVMFDF